MWTKLYIMPARTKDAVTVAAIVVIIAACGKGGALLP